jgi:hypothetical protein
MLPFSKAQALGGQFLPSIIDVSILSHVKNFSWDHSRRFPKSQGNFCVTATSHLLLRLENLLIISP